MRRLVLVYWIEYIARRSDGLALRGHPFAEILRRHDGFYLALAYSRVQGHALVRGAWSMADAVEPLCLFFPYPERQEEF